MDQTKHKFTMWAIYRDVEC